MVAPKTTVFLGSGGVGKTTLSALYALKLAQQNPNQKVRLVTIDPSKRLKDLFTLEEGQVYQKENLSVSLGDRTKLFDQFIQEVCLKNKMDSEVFKTNRFFRALMDNLAVSQEFTSLYEVYRTHQSKDVDIAIIDTPPLQNAGDFLSGAKTLKNFFSGPLVKFFIPEKDRGIWYLVANRARRLSLEALARLTGSNFIDELAEFFKVTEEIKTEILKVVKEAEKILEKRAALNLICNFKELSLKSVLVGAKELEKQNLKISYVYVNKYQEAESGQKVNFNLLEDLQTLGTLKKIPLFPFEPLDVESLIQAGEKIEI